MSRPTGRFWAVDTDRLRVVAVVAERPLPVVNGVQWWVHDLGKYLYESPTGHLFPATPEGEADAVVALWRHCVAMVNRYLPAERDAEGELRRVHRERVAYGVNLIEPCPAYTEDRWEDSRARTD